MCDKAGVAARPAIEKHILQLPGLAVVEHLHKPPHCCRSRRARAVFVEGLFLIHNKHIKAVKAVYPSQFLGSLAKTFHRKNYHIRSPQGMEILIINLSDDFNLAVSALGIESDYPPATGRRSSVYGEERLFSISESLIHFHLGRVGNIPYTSPGLCTRKRDGTSAFKTAEIHHQLRGVVTQHIVARIDDIRAVNRREVRRSRRRHCECAFQLKVARAPDKVRISFSKGIEYCGGRVSGIDRSYF